MHTKIQRRATVSRGNMTAENFELIEQALETMAAS